MSSAREQRLIITLAAASFAVLGACLTLPGTLLPLLVDQFGMRLIEAGSMLALQPIAYLLSVLTAERLLRRFGMQAVVSGSIFLFAIGIGGFGLTSNAVAGGALLFFSGLGFGVMEVALNTLMVRVGGERSANVLNFVHLFFGVGSFIAPAITAHAVAAGMSWRGPFLVAGAATAGVAVGWRLAGIARATHPSPTSDSAGRDRLDLALAVLLALLLGVYVGVEMGIGGWLTKYMTGTRSVTLTFAGNTLSAYWLGLAAGRLALAGVAHYVREERLILGLSIGSTATGIVALVMSSPWATAIAFAATGVGFAGIFPGVIALGGRHHPHNTAAVTSVLIAGAGLGGIVIPWTMSLIADRVSVTAGMIFYAAMSAVMIALAATVILVVRRAPRGTTSVG
jgi:fucose permease